MIRFYAHRSCSFLALLAATVFIGWPGAVRGSCCEQTAPFQRDQSVQRASLDTTGHASCCTSKADDQTESHCSTDIDSQAGDDFSRPCDCSKACCLTTTANAIFHGETQDDLAWALHSSEVLIEFPVDAGNQRADGDYPVSLFLPAQDHCAKFCCWLK